MKYYTLKNILKHNAKYNVIFGERSNGKTYSVFEKAIKDYCTDGSQLGLVRRWSEDFTGKRGSAMFNAVVKDGLVKKYTKGEWTDIYYYASKWYFCRYDEKGKREMCDDVFAYGFAVTAQEHDKSTAYPRIRNVLFDEFITRNVYLPDEFVLFCNVLSTIIRQRTDVTIFMLGNTVNKFCPYFAEMGLKHIQEMKPGDVDIYNYGESGLTVAVEYATMGGIKKGKPSDIYFAFDNAKLNMITKGEWELDIYPHCPAKYRPCEILFNFFIIFNEQTLHAEIIQTVDGIFCFIHEKTTPIKNENDLIFTADFSSHKYTVRRSILKPIDKIGEKIAFLFTHNKVFYSTNEVGNAVANYLKIA